MSAMPTSAAEYALWESYKRMARDHDAQLEDEDDFEDLEDIDWESLWDEEAEEDEESEGDEDEGGMFVLSGGDDEASHGIAVRDEDENDDDDEEAEPAAEGGNPEDDADDAGGVDGGSEDDEKASTSGDDDATEAARDEAKEEPEEEADDEEAGSEEDTDPSKSWMDHVDPEALEAANFDKAVAKKIGEEAVSSATASDYVIYSKDFDRIEPFVPGSTEGPEVERLEEKTRHMVGVMQKDIERMMAARSQVLNVPGFRSGKLHTTSLHRLSVGDARVFRRRQESRSKDVEVCLLIDCSGSMHADGRIGVAMTAAFALSSTLERVGIRHECIGFTTHTDVDQREIHAEQRRIGRQFSRWEPLYMPIFKGFDERLTPTVKRRFATAAHELRLRNNVDGECVEIAARRLLKRKAARRVLIVLSDGEPAALGVWQEQTAHMKRAVKWAESAGVETIGIGIETNAVQDYYPKHVVLWNLDQLPKAVMDELKKIL